MWTPPDENMLSVLTSCIFYIFYLCLVTLHVKWTAFFLRDTNVLLVPNMSESYPSFMPRSIRGVTIPVKENLLATVKRWKKTRRVRERIACTCRVHSVPPPHPPPPGGYLGSIGGGQGSHRSAQCIEANLCHCSGDPSAQRHRGVKFKLLLQAGNSIIWGKDMSLRHILAVFLVRRKKGRREGLKASPLCG